MADLILVQPPIEDFYLTLKRTIPYGLACIAGSLRQKGFSVDLFDALAVNRSKIIPLPEALTPLSAYYGREDCSSFALFHHFKHYGYSYEHISRVIKEKKPCIAGISSLFTPYFDQALKTAETIKHCYPECIIVMGGHHPTNLPETVMVSKHVDFVIRGEGETAMPMLARAILNRRTDPETLKKIPGIVFRKKDNTLYISEPAWLERREEFSLPAMDLVKSGFYRRKKTHSTSIVTSRGCPMHCSYCSVGASAAWSPRFRQRNAEDVVSELAGQFQARDIGFVDFEDENLTLDKKWFLDFLNRAEPLFKKNRPELRAMNGLFPPSLDPEVVRAMKASGFKTINLSLGSNSRDQLKRFNRPDVRKAFKKALLLAKHHHMQSVSYIIAGAPGQDSLDSLSDLIFLAEMPTLAGMSIFYPAPGSLDYQVCREKNLLPDSFLMMRSTALPISHTTTRRESITLLRLSRIVNFMKFLVDTKIPIPGPEPWTKHCTLDAGDRIKTGKTLLSWFLFDGNIRGITRDNQVFIHLQDKDLTRIFIEKIKQTRIKGTIV